MTQLEKRQAKFLKALKKGPKTAASVAKELDWDAATIKTVGQSLLKAGKIEAGANKTLQLVEEETPAKKKSKITPPSKKKVADPDDDDDDDDGSDTDDDDDDPDDPDTDDDDDDDDDPEDIEDETFGIIKVSAKNNSIFVEHEDERIELVADEDEIDVTDFEKGQEVTLSATYDADDEEWTLTEIEGDDDDDLESDTDDDDDDDPPPVKKHKGKKAKEAPVKKGKKAKRTTFTMSYKPIDLLDDEELEERVTDSTEAAEELFTKFPHVAEMLMRSVARANKQLKKRNG